MGGFDSICGAGVTVVLVVEQPTAPARVNAAARDRRERIDPPFFVGGEYSQTKRFQPPY
jgi:hypothetical protein